MENLQRDLQKAIPSQLAEAASAAEQLGSMVSAVGTQIFSKVSASAIENTTKFSEVAADSAHAALEQTTESVGETLNPVAENPVVDFVAKVPGLGWLTSALGRVDKASALEDVLKLKQKHPNDSAEELAHHIIVDTTLKAGGVGFAANIIPPIALGLFAVDLAAVSALQSEMLYRIAAAYDFDISDPARKGEALTIFTLSVGTSSAMKAGLGVVELVPIVGAAVGASSNAGLIYSFGTAASQFYKRKQARQAGRK